MDSLPLIATLFALTACIYATVGFGGGSMYLALLALFGTAYTALPQIALCCNIVVVSGGCYHFLRARERQALTLWPLLLTSVPAAFIGGRIPIARTTFLFLLGLALAVAGIRLLIVPTAGVERRRVALHPIMMAIGGAAIGLFSGLIGIGGGIFLAPLLYLAGWGHPRAIAAASSLFILVNSVAGLCGQVAKTGWAVAPIPFGVLGLAVLIGGQCGTRLCVYRLRPVRLQQCTALFLIAVAGKILWGVWSA